MSDAGSSSGAAPGTRRAAPATLDHAGIAARVPHAGSMCLLERLLRWDDASIECAIVNHADPSHPLRDHAHVQDGGNKDGGEGEDLGLPSPTAIEFAAQAMALHASLTAAEGAQPTPGFLASARDVRLHVPRLDTAPGPLVVKAHRLAGDVRQAMYRFELADAGGRLLVEGRTTVVLNTPLPRPGPAAAQAA